MDIGTIIINTLCIDDFQTLGLKVYICRFGGNQQWFWHPLTFLKINMFICSELMGTIVMQVTGLNDFTIQLLQQHRLQMAYRSHIVFDVVLITVIIFEKNKSLK